MPLYLISYDEHNERDYEECYKLLVSWHGVRLLESLWLANLRGPAEVLQRFVSATFDGDASVAVIEVPSNSDWATANCYELGIEMLQAN